MNGSRQGVVCLGKRIAPEEPLREAVEYVLLMNAIPRGESIPEVLRREAYIVPDIIDALTDIHRRSLRLSDAEQWQYGKADTLRERIMGADLTYYRRALTQFEKIRNKPIPEDEILRHVSQIAGHQRLAAMCDDMIARGHIVDGHGNLWRENLQRGVYYHTKRLRRRSQAIQCIDPGTNPLFTKQSVVMEAGMLLVDLQVQLSDREFASATRRYLRKMQFTDNAYARTLLLIAKGHKASVRFYNAVLGDYEYDLADRFLAISMESYAQAAAILQHPRTVNHEIALQAF